MPSRPLPALKRACLLLLPSFAAGCVSSPDINVSQTALPCWEMIEASGLLEPTPGTALPANDTAGEIGAFGVRQTGQLAKANADKGGVRKMGRICDDRQAAALKEAQRRTRKKVLGIF